MTRLIGEGRPSLDPSFERGADHPATIKALNDPPRSAWLRQFISDRIDGLLLVTGSNRSSVTFHSNELTNLLGTSIRVVYSEIGSRGRAAHRRARASNSRTSLQPAHGGLGKGRGRQQTRTTALPGQDLLWPGEFVFGYPGQHPGDADKEGPAPQMVTPWMRNGSYMVFRRLEQKVPEFRQFCSRAGCTTGDGCGTAGGANGRPLEERHANGAYAAARQSSARTGRRPQQ